MNDTKTLSLCHICYKHIPAERITKNNAVYLIKTCPEHGRMEYMVEHDVEFYNSLEYDREGYSIPQGIMIEVTDRCNLNCPHCYHEPDNKVVDRSIDSILKQIEENVHPEAGAIILAGAEPTVRKDLPELVEAICKQIKDLSLIHI